ncbi:uncharacterized protein LY89DRAFT_410850 [Mollisia scopiformis]|uniref:Uncharacterized protein n=1 Tax=Mollisia scopiformis TaxID=149040 RepID=A0A132B223_MOLSC|nr:uncharacterized protein LY89DRAFT_410850 [Mollisia scopiformis]KUJ06361.1 hypothetical protein LY89DRAFT_410850 [Mollisia scopiformis]
MSSAENYDHLLTFDGGEVDLIATYKGKRVAGKVVSGAMGLASPVWKKLLLGTPEPRAAEINAGDKAANPETTTKPIDCTDDDGEALLILLCISHLQFSDTPRKPKLILLFNIAVLCEKYDCHDLVRPWSSRWLKDLWPASRLFKVDHDRCLYIAWALGEQEYFKAISKDLVATVHLVGPDRKATNGRDYIDRGPMPDGIIESILQARTKTIQALLDLPYTYIERFKNGTSTVCKLKSESCDAIMYGSLLLQLGRIGLWPKKEAKDYTSSLLTLERCIRNLAPTSLPVIPGADGENHSDCKATCFRHYANEIMNRPADPKLECQRKHMQKRSKPKKTQYTSSKKVEEVEKESLIITLKVAPKPGTQVGSGA